MKIEDILLNLNSPIYICGHIKPDQDSICSCLALANFLNYIGKESYVLLEEKDKDVLNWINNHSLIVSEIKEQKYNFIALDLNEKKRLGSFEKHFDNASYTINIDHHQDNKNEADFVYSLPGISSTCEIIYNILNNIDSKQLKNKEICEYLYSGILNDTNCFSRRLSKNTLRITQKLINSGINYQEIINKTLKEKSMYEFKALAKLVNEIKYDGFHYIVIDKEDENYNKLTHNQIVKKLAEDLRTIREIDILVVLIKDKNTIISKCMTKTSENADKIASLFGGGGHKKEAGFTVNDISINEIINRINVFLNAKKILK